MCNIPWQVCHLRWSGCDPSYDQMVLWMEHHGSQWIFVQWSQPTATLAITEIRLRSVNDWFVCWEILALHMVIHGALTWHHRPGFILGLHPANERRCNKIKASLIGWAQTQNQPCKLPPCGMGVLWHGSHKGRTQMWLVTYERHHISALHVSFRVLV